MLRRGARLLPQLARSAAPTDAAAAAAAWPADALGGIRGGVFVQDVQQQQHQAWQPSVHAQQRRQSAAALPQPEYASDEDDHPPTSSSGGDAQPQQLREYHRRLREMLDSNLASSSSSGGEGSSAATRSAAWPTPQEVAERLRSGQSASCNSAAAPAPAPAEDAGSSGSGALDWREVVAAARRHQEVSGAEMLTDTFGRRHTYLRISLTERCNLRCLYCMPEQGVDLTPSQQLMSTEEVMRVARLFAAAGVDKIRLTGGEPTLRPDLVELTARLAALPGIKHVGLTSNGLALGRKLPALREAGLSLLNISLDTLRPDRFTAMTRRQGHDRVLAAIHAAVELGYDPVKVNVVVMRGVNDDEVPAFVELTRDAPINVRFIEYMPFDGNVWSDSKMVPYRDMLAAVQARFGALERCADPRGEVAKNFRVPGFRGSVSFITSMTKAFCSDCNRLRVMADGNLKVCLFGANEVSLRDAMREGASDSDLKAIVSAAVDRKRAAHAGMFELAATANRAMVKIGVVWSFSRRSHVARQSTGGELFDDGGGGGGGELHGDAEAQALARLEERLGPDEHDEGYESGMEDDDEGGLDGGWDEDEGGDGGEAGGMEEGEGEEDDGGGDDSGGEEPQQDEALATGALEDEEGEEEEPSAAAAVKIASDGQEAAGDDAALQDVHAEEDAGEEAGEGEPAGAAGSQGEAGAAHAAGRQWGEPEAAAGQPGSSPDLDAPAAAQPMPASPAEPAAAAATAAAAVAAAPAPDYAVVPSAEAPNAAGLDGSLLGSAAAAPSVGEQPSERQQQQQQGGAGSAATGSAQAAAADMALPAQAAPAWKPRCAVVNNRNWHLDVAAGLAWAFQAAGCEVTTYLPDGTLGIDDVMSAWYRGDRRHVLKLQNDSYRYDAIILVTFPETHTHLLESLLYDDLPGRTAARRKSQRFLAVVHNPDRLLSRKSVKHLVAQHAVERPGAPPPRLQLLTLAPSTATYTRQLVQRWLRGISGTPNSQLPLRWLSPLVPWRPSFSPVEIRRAGDNIFTGDNSLRHLCIQGILDPTRRDYAGAFKALAHPAVLSELRARNESLLLLGHAAHAPLQVPAGVRQYVKQLTGLPYKEYYDTLSRCRAILPAFASDDYFVRKSSSTVATALNVGSPLLAEDRLHDAYSFIPAEAMFGFAPPRGASALDVAALAAEAAAPFIKADAAAAAGGEEAEEEGEEEWEDVEAEEAAYKAAQRQAAAAAAPLASATPSKADARKASPPLRVRRADVADEEDAEEGPAEVAEWGREAAAKADAADEDAEEEAAEEEGGKAAAKAAAAVGDAEEEAAEEEGGKAAAAGEDELLPEELEVEAAAADAAQAAAKKKGSSRMAGAVAAVEEDAKGEAAAADAKAEAADAEAEAEAAEAAAAAAEAEAEAAAGAKELALGEEEELALEEEEEEDDEELAQLAAAASRGGKRAGGKRGRRLLAAASAQAAGQKLEAAAQAAKGDEEAPQPGSYAAAMLRAFQPGTAAAAHAAARQTKSEVMVANRQVAADFLAGAAALAAAHEAEQADSSQSAGAAKTAAAAAAAKGERGAAAGKPPQDDEPASEAAEPAPPAGSAHARRAVPLLPRNQRSDE